MARFSGAFLLILHGSVLLAQADSTSTAPAYQVSARFLVNGSTMLTVPPGPVDLTLDMELSTNIALSAMQFSLECSSPDSFAYATPAITNGHPFTQEDFDFVPVDPPIKDGDPLSIMPEIILFRLAPGNYPVSDFPSIILTFHIRSIASLPEGTYTFRAGETTLPPIWVSTTEDSSEIIDGEITTDPANVFTLTVKTNTDSSATQSADENDSNQETDVNTPDSGNGDGTKNTDTNTEENSSTNESNSPNSTPSLCASGTGAGFMTVTGLGLWVIGVAHRRRSRWVTKF